MQASFNGARKHLAADFNSTVKSMKGSEVNPMTKRHLGDLRSDIVGLLCMYDDECEGDIDMLMDEVSLVTVEGVLK